jgi:hypothetical protein
VRQRMLWRLPWSWTGALQRLCPLDTGQGLRLDVHNGDPLPRDCKFDAVVCSVPLDLLDASKLDRVSGGYVHSVHTKPPEHYVRSDLSRGDVRRLDRQYSCCFGGVSTLSREVYIVLGTNVGAVCRVFNAAIPRIVCYSMPEVYV